MSLISKAIKSGLALKAFQMLKRGFQIYKDRKIRKSALHRPH